MPEITTSNASSLADLIAALQAEGIAYEDMEIDVSSRSVTVDDGEGGITYTLAPSKEDTWTPSATA